MPNRNSDRPRIFRFPPWWATLLWIVLILGVLGRVVCSSPTTQSVVPIYLNAGDRWLHGEDVYAPAPPLDLFRNPPPVATFFTPWSLLPEKLAALAWRVLSIACFLYSLWRIESLYPPLTSGCRGLMYVIAIELVLPSFNNGQVNVLLISAVLIGAADAAGKKYRSAAFWLSVASWLKGYPLAAALLLTVAAPMLAAWFVLFLAAGFVFSLIGHPQEYVLQQYRCFLELLELDDRTHAPIHRIPRDWRIVPRIWADVVIATSVAKLVSALAGVLMALWVIVVRHLAGQLEAIRLAVGLAAIWMTLLGPATEDVTYSLIAPVMAITLARFPRGRLGVLTWSAYLLLVLPILRGLFPSCEICPLRTVQPIGALLLLIVIVLEPWAAPGKKEIPEPAVSGTQGLRVSDRECVNASW